jgi:predicted RNA-binding Zn-ribbon protein involved in translation (DUF1610 family)
MICPNCGAEMNYHAKKIDQIASAQEPGAADPDLGGVVQEIHSCPKCGKSAWRRSTS